MAYQLKGAVLNAAGTGYQVGDEITIAGGNAVITVTQVDPEGKGAVVAFSLGNSTSNSFAADPTGTASATVTTGEGTGLTLNLTAVEIASDTSSRAMKNMRLGGR